MRSILYGSKAREAIMRGVNAVVACVGTTLGPAGRNALIVRPMRDPISSRDGATVLRNIELDDELDGVGCRLIQGVSLQQAMEAGDSTTSVAILAQAIAQRAIAAVNAGANPVTLKREIENASAAIGEKLQANAVPLDKNSLLKVALLAANDADLGTLIAQAFEAAGTNGLVGAEESQNISSSLRVSEGMEISAGYLTHLFVNDAEKQRVVLERPYILLLDRKLSILNGLVNNILAPIVEQGRSLLIVADDCDGDAIRNLVAQKTKLRVCVAKPPFVGEYKKDLLEDIAVATGGTAILQETGLTDMLDKLSLGQLGQAERVIVTRHTTTIIGGAGEAKNITARAELMVSQIAALMADQRDRKKDIARMEQRLARFGGKIVLLALGAPTRLELEDLKLRAEDALYAVRGARDTGVVPGGGSSLLRHSASVDAELHTLGSELLKESCATLLRALCANAGLSETQISEVNERLLNRGEGRVYDVRAGCLRDPWDAGVLDPLSVVSSCLANAVSVACQILLTESLVINTPDSPMKMFEKGVRDGQR